MKIINNVEKGKIVRAKDAKIGKVYKFFNTFVTPINVCDSHRLSDTDLFPFIDVSEDFSTHLFCQNESLEYVGELSLVIE